MGGQVSIHEFRGEFPEEGDAESLDTGSSGSTVRKGRGLCGGLAISAALGEVCRPLKRMNDKRMNDAAHAGAGEVEASCSRSSYVSASQALLLTTRHNKRLCLDTESCNCCLRLQKPE